MYSQNEAERKMERAIKYAYTYLTYLDDGNELLQTNDVLYFGEERTRRLTGEEHIEKGIYTLWTGAHDGIEWLQRFDTMEEAMQNKQKWEKATFSPCDFCGILEVKE